MILKNNNNFSKINRTVFIRKYVFRKRTVIFLLLFGSIISGYWASKFVKTKGYNGLYDFVSSVTFNYFKGLKANPETLSIQIDDKDYKKLEKNRARALERGVIINDIDGNYVSATLEHNGKKADVKLRLKGHMIDHLQDNKWSFRIKVKDNDSFMGMKRFSIQHPGTRGYIYEWIYHELMKREDIIALRYKFINITVNGRDWGIYALEENFENELIENNHRLKGPILRYNPDLYWVNRYNELKAENACDEYASYYSANPEAYRENKILGDSIQKKYYLKAISLIEGLRSKQINVEQAFDIPRLAKFHAIIDLVGGVHSIDWSDIKYYYNPVSGKLEPVAYESFTNLESKDLSALYKYVQIDSAENYIDWHTMIFSNRSFYSEYIKQLERVTDPVFLDRFFSDSNTELQNNLAIIYKEFPYKKFDKNQYYKRQYIIRKIISPPKALHAYLKGGSDKVIKVQVAAIDALPVQINSIIINKVRSAVESFVLPAKQPNKYVHYKDLQFKMPDDFKWDEKLSDSVTIEYSILGSSEKKEVKVFPFPHTDCEYIAAGLKNKQSTVGSFSFLVVNENSKIILIKSGKQIIDKDMIIPPGYKLIAEHGLSIDIKNNAKIISYSAIDLRGTEDEPIIIESSDSTGQGIEILNASKSMFRYAVFKNLPKVHDEEWARSAAITFYESNVEFSNCSFYNSKAEDGVNLIRSDFLFKECLFQKMANDALDVDFSEGEILNCVFEDCKENALDITMSKLNVSSIYVNGVGNKAFNLKAGTQLKGKDIRIKNATIGISAEDLCTIDLKAVTITDAEIGLTAYKNKPGGGHPTLTVSGLVFKNVKTTILKEKKSAIVANGVTIVDEVEDVEKIIKGDKKGYK